MVFNVPSFLTVDPAMLKTEERILVTAMNVFADHPPNLATLRQIAKEGNLSFSSITYHFKTKENLYREVIRRIMSFVVPALIGQDDQDQAAQNASPDQAWEKLRQLIGNMADLVYGSTLASRIARIILREHLHPTSIYEEIYEDFFAKLIGRISRLIGRVRPDLSDRRATLQAFNILGQLLGFRIEREMLVRNLQFTGFSPEEIEELKEVLLENTARQLGRPVAD